MAGPERSRTGRYISGSPHAIGCAEWRWVRLNELDHYAFPTANRKVIAALQPIYKPGRAH